MSEIHNNSVICILNTHEVMNFFARLLFRIQVKLAKIALPKWNVLGKDLDLSGHKLWFFIPLFHLNTDKINTQYSMQNLESKIQVLISCNGF